MPEFDLHFSPLSSQEAACFKLLELPPELANLVETAISQHQPLNFVVKGDPTEDAVLCTEETTYSIRNVNLSNSLLVVSPPPDYAPTLDFSENAVVIRDQANEVLELTATVPKISKLMGLLRGREYDETNEGDGDEEHDQTSYTYTQAREEIQASDTELDLALKRKRVLVIKDELRAISLPYLNTILESTLNVLIARALPHSSASVNTLTSNLDKEHEIAPVVSRQVLEWFGEIQNGKWKMNVDEVIKELGLGVLREHTRDNPIEKGQLEAKWKEAVGDTFEDRVALTLLIGNYLEHKNSVAGQDALSYFPCSALPTDPAARFSDLFLTRSRWRVEDITPFLTDIAVSPKERDKLLLKYCRALSESGGVWYTARAQYHG